MGGATRRRAEYSLESASAMNNRNLRDSDSYLRGSAKNLQDVGSLRDSANMENGVNFSLKKNKRNNQGVQLAPLFHPSQPSSLKSDLNILSQGRASIPLSGRQNGQDVF